MDDFVESATIESLPSDFANFEPFPSSSSSDSPPSTPSASTTPNGTPNFSYTAADMELPVFRSVRSLSSPAPVPVPSPYEDSYWNSLANDYDSIDAETVFQNPDHLPLKAGPKTQSASEGIFLSGNAGDSEKELEHYLVEAAKFAEEKKNAPVFFPGPDEEPVFVEKYSSFFSESAAPALLDAIDSVLQDCGAETERKLSKYKIRAQASGEESPCSFIARIYRSRKQTGKFVVEFQRRSGCTVQFNQIYRRAVSILNGLDSAHVSAPYLETCSLNLKSFHIPEGKDKNSCDLVEKNKSANKYDFNASPWRVFQHQHHFVGDLCDTCKCTKTPEDIAENLPTALSLTR